MGESLLLYALHSPQTLTGNIALLCPKVTILGKDGPGIVAPSQSWLLGKRPEFSGATYALATPPCEILGKLLFVHLYLKAIHYICQPEPLGFYCCTGESPTELLYVQT